MMIQFVGVLLVLQFLLADCINNFYQEACAEDASGKSFCDINLSFQERIADLLPRFSIDEKSCLLTNNACPIRSLNISNYQWWNEGLHGVAGSPGVRFNGKLKHATSFPQVITTSQSFNKTLFFKIGQATSTEARAFYSADQAGLTYWSPNVNVFRDPRWGRGHETPGEDPLLNSDYAAYYVQGMQATTMQGNHEKYLKVSSCCKHFAAYSLEGGHGDTDRRHFNAIVSARDMKETYLPAFESCVRRGNASSIMCSYNAVNGKPTCADKDLLDGLARDEWHFDGYITSDCGAVFDVLNSHHYAKDANETCFDVLQAGMDLNCGSFLKHFLPEALRSGAVSEALVDRALGRLLRVQMRLGLFDPPSSNPYNGIGVEHVNTKYHQALALDAARQGIVLLKNHHNVAPLKLAAGKRIAVMGPFANATTLMQGNYFGNAPYLISPLEGLTQQFPTNPVTYLKACDIDTNSSLHLDQAIHLANQSDIVVLVVGTGSRLEGEGLDRSSIELPYVQQQLIRGTSKAVGQHKPIVVVVMAGGSVDIGFVKHDKNLDVILWTGYPGQSGGQAIAEVLAGSVNPSGRLTQTIYHGNFTTQVRMDDMRMHADSSTGYPGRGYRFFSFPVVYQFGDGLSYTDFQYDLIDDSMTPLLATNLRGTTQLQSVIQEAWLRVRNIGDCQGNDVLLMYLRFPDGTKKLIDYRRSPLLQSGQSHVFQESLRVQQTDFFSFREDGERHIQKGVYQLLFNQESSYRFQFTF